MHAPAGHLKSMRASAGHFQLFSLSKSFTFSNELHLKSYEYLLKNKDIFLLKTMRAAAVLCHDGIEIILSNITPAKRLMAQMLKA